ncbi:hypothetical protein [Planctopirus limnophila]|nr:hypothetical protein [Planctopirus limnophila]
MLADEACEMALMGGEGLEQPPLSSLKTAFPGSSGAESGAVQNSSALVAGLVQALATDADLRRLAACWGRLSPDDRQALASHAEAMAAARGSTQYSRTGKPLSKDLSAR